MLNLKSTVKDIEYYLDQMQMLIINDDENKKIEKIIALKELIDDDSIKSLIAEDLKDESWIYETSVLINTCLNRINKSNSILSHIEDCKNFLCFRILEDKLLTIPNLQYEKNENLFYIINEKTSDVVWSNSKLFKYFENSSIKKHILSLDNPISLNLDFLYMNKSVFFTNSIFSNINTKNTIVKNFDDKEFKQITDSFAIN